MTALAPTARPQSWPLTLLVLALVVVALLSAPGANAATETLYNNGNVSCKICALLPHPPCLTSRRYRSDVQFEHRLNIHHLTDVLCWQRLHPPTP